MEWAYQRINAAAAIEHLVGVKQVHNRIHWFNRPGTSSLAVQPGTNGI